MTAVPPVRWRRAASVAVRAVTATALAAGAVVVGSHTEGGLPAASAQVPGQCEADNPQFVTQPIPAFAALGIPEAWNYSRGNGVTVAVVDSGVVGSNIHFEDALVEGVNVVRSDDPADNAAVNHGTAAAGIIAARRVSGSEVVGVAPQAQIAPVRVYYAESDQARDEDVHLTPQRMADGIAWAAGSGAQIINVSLSTTTDHPDLRAAVEEAQDAGVLVIASAGNRATATNLEDVPRYPAAYDGVLGVSAVDVDGRWWPEASFASDFVDLAAPGQHVPTAFLAANDCILEPGDTAPSASWATAYVSGVAALVAARYPEETAEQWAHRLLVTATRASSGQRDDQVGWGIVRPVAALQFIDDGSVRGPQSPVHPAPPEPERPQADLDLTQHPDPMATAKQAVSWTLVAGIVVAALALLTGRLRSRSTQRRR